MKQQKKNYINFLTKDENPRTGLCQRIKTFYRKVIKYESAPLHEFEEQVTEKKYHEIIDAFGECIYKKIIDGGIYYLPCLHLGRLYIRRISKNEKNKNGGFRFPKFKILGVDSFSIWWSLKRFKNEKYTFVLLKNTRKIVRTFREDTQNSLCSYYDKNIKSYDKFKRNIRKC